MVGYKDVVAVVSTYGSSVCEPASNIYENAKKVNIGYGVTAVRLTERGFKYFFRTCGRDDSQGEFFAKSVPAKFNAKRIAIMHDNTAFGKGLAENARDALKPMIDSKQVEIVYYDAITPGEKDFKVPLTKLRETKPDVWYYTGYFAEAALLVSQAKQIGVKAPFVGGNAAINDEFVKIAGVQNAKGSYMTNEPLPQDLPSAEAKAFLAAYKAKYGDIPSSPWPIYAADAVNIIAYAIDKTEVDRLDQARRLPARHGRRRAGHHRQDRLHRQGRPRGRALLPVHRRRSGQDRRVEVASSSSRGRRRRAAAPELHAMRVFVEQLVNGLTLGSFFGLIALGYSMVYGVLKMINFVHGDFFTLGSYLGYTVLVFGSAAATRAARRLGRDRARGRGRRGRARRRGARGRAHRLPARLQGGPPPGRRVGAGRLDHPAEPDHARVGAALPGVPRLRGRSARGRRAARSRDRHAHAGPDPRGLARSHGACSPWSSRRPPGARRCARRRSTRTSPPSWASTSTG